MNARLPNFLIIGAMKSGTTTLHQYLTQHPRVFMSTPKEPNFFSMDDVFQRGADWYGNLFAQAGEDQICGEASPSYTRFPRFPDTPARLAELLPNAKLVYIMRHPVDRFYSNYVFDRAYGHSDSIRETLKDRDYVLNTSNYMLQIEKYLDHFPREQMCFLLLEDLERDAEQALRQLWSFLGVDAQSAATKEPVRANPRGRNYMARKANTTLRRFRAIPGVSIAKQIVPAGLRTRIRESAIQSLPDSRIGKWLSRRHTGKTEPLTNELRRELLGRLAASTEQLEAFLGRDLTAWKS